MHQHYGLCIKTTYFFRTYTQSWSTSRGISSMLLIPIQLSAALSGFYRGTPILKQFTSVAMFVDQPKLGTVWSHRFEGTERVTVIDMQYSFWTWKSKLGYLQKKIRYCTSSKKNKLQNHVNLGENPGTLLFTSKHEPGCVHVHSSSTNGISSPMWFRWSTRIWDRCLPLAA